MVAVLVRHPGEKVLGLVHVDVGVPVAQDMPVDDGIHVVGGGKGHALVDVRLVAGPVPLGAVAHDAHAMGIHGQAHHVHTHVPGQLPKELVVEEGFSDDEIVGAHAPEHDGLALLVGELAVHHLQMPAAGRPGPAVVIHVARRRPLCAHPGRSGQHGHEQHDRQQQRQNLFHPIHLPCFDLGSVPPP